MSVNCPFCTLNESRQLFSNELAYAIADSFPVTRGHCLIIPKRHFQSLFEATPEERSALWALVEQTRQYLLNESVPVPDGFNVGINDGSAAGQTVMHLHIHLIPRYTGDSDDPRGGVRWIMPDKAPYWKKSD